MPMILLDKATALGLDQGRSCDDSRNQLVRYGWSLARYVLAAIVFWSQPARLLPASERDHSLSLLTQSADAEVHHLTGTQKSRRLDTETDPLRHPGRIRSPG